MNKVKLLSDLEKKYSEWLEMSENPDALLKTILVNLLADSLDELEYYKKLRTESENVCKCRTRVN